MTQPIGCSCSSRIRAMEADMKRLLLLVVLGIACLLPATSPAQAQACASFPSSQCPAPGVQPGTPSYPCFGGQVKADWNSMTFYLPSQQFYGVIGSDPRSNTWCFADAGGAASLGFHGASS